MSVKKYTLETETVVWELMTGTVPNSQTINELFQDIVKKHIVESYTMSYVEQSPRFESEHVERFKELQEQYGSAASESDD